MSVERWVINPVDEDARNLPVLLTTPDMAIPTGIHLAGVQWPESPYEVIRTASPGTDGAKRAGRKVGTKDLGIEFLMIEPDEPQCQNLILDPSCEGDPALWAVTGSEVWDDTAGFYTNAGASIMQETDATRALHGDRYLAVSCPGTATSEGVEGRPAEDPIGGVFRIGQTYRFDLYLRGHMGGERVQICLGAPTAPDFINPDFTLTPEWTRYGVAWTPTGDREASAVAYAIRTSTVAQRCTFFVDAAMVYRASNGIQNYFDGDTPGCQWRARARNSLSNRPPASSFLQDNHDVVGLVTNPSGEAANNEWQAELTGGGSITNNAVRYTAWAKSGNASIRATATGVPNGQALAISRLAANSIHAIPCRPGDKFAAIGTANFLAAHTGYTWMGIEFFTSGGGYVGADGATPSRIHTAFTGIEEFSTGVATAPATAAWARPVIAAYNTSGANATIDFAADAVQMIRSSVPLTTYFDGDSPGCEWEGIPHRSRSIWRTKAIARRHAIATDIEEIIEKISREGGGTLRRNPPGGGLDNQITFDVIDARMKWDRQTFIDCGVATGSMTLSCQPFGRGVPLINWADDFAKDQLWKYIVPNKHQGGDIGNVRVSGGVLDAEVNLTAQNYILYDNLPYPLHGGEVQAKLHTGATIVNMQLGVIVKATDWGGMLLAEIFRDATTGYIRFLKTDGQGNTSHLDGGTVAATFTIAANTDYWIRGRLQDNTVTVEAFTSFPSDGGTPAASVSGTLTAKEIREFGLDVGGKPGIWMVPQATGAFVDDFIVKPNYARETVKPVLIWDVGGIKGTAPAAGRLILRDIASQNQYYAHWGMEAKDYPGDPTAATHTLFMEAESCVLENGAALGSDASASGGGNNVVNFNFTPSWTSMLRLETASIERQHVGSYRVFARAKMTNAKDPGPHLCLQWAVGDDVTVVRNPEVTLPYDFNSWNIVDLGTIHIPPAPSTVPMVTALPVAPAPMGQRWIGRILARGIQFSPNNVRLDCIWLVPIAEGSGEFFSQTPSVEPGQMSRRDDFYVTTSGGNLAGRTAPAGGTWSVIGDTTPTFTFADSPGGGLEGGEWIQRAATSDATYRGAVAILGSNTIDSHVQVSFARDQDAATATGAIQAVCARVVDINNLCWGGVVLDPADIGLNSAKHRVEVLVSGNPVVIDEVQIPRPLAQRWYAARLIVWANGKYVSRIYDIGMHTTLGWTGGLALDVESLLLISEISGYNAALATGGALAQGAMGFMDSNTSVTAFGTRYYDSFWGSDTALHRVLSSGSTIEVHSDRVLRDDFASGIGSFPLGAVKPLYEGSYLTLPPATTGRGRARFIAKASRGEPGNTGSDAAIDDFAGQVLWTPRYPITADAR